MSVVRNFRNFLPSPQGPCAWGPMVENAILGTPGVMTLAPWYGRTDAAVPGTQRSCSRRGYCTRQVVLSG